MLFAAIAQQHNGEVQMADDECGNALACLQVDIPCLSLLCLSLPFIGLPFDALPLSALCSVLCLCNCPYQGML